MNDEGRKAGGARNRRPGREGESLRPTLADVARHAGVSTATVSRCLSAPDRVVEATRARVLAAVEALGYAPNFSARSLAARRTNTIGAIIPTMDNAIFARTLQAFQEELGRHGFTLLVASSSYQADLEEEQIGTLLARGADGLLLIGHARAREVHDMIMRRGVPFLVAWVYDPDLPWLSVGFDNRAAMSGLADAVLTRGHRRLAVISAPQAFNDRARHRVEGVRAAMAAHGLDAADLRVLETDYGIDSGAEAMARLLGEAPRPTAVLCGNDVLAVGAMSAARAAGLRIPEDVSITGFDDIEIARVVEPPLATVHVPHRAMGIEAARRLVAILTGAVPEPSLCLETRLCLRGSLGPCPDDAG